MTTAAVAAAHALLEQAGSHVAARRQRELDHAHTVLHAVAGLASESAPDRQRYALALRWKHDSFDSFDSSGDGGVYYSVYVDTAVLIPLLDVDDDTEYDPHAVYELDEIPADLSGYQGPRTDLPAETVALLDRLLDTVDLTDLAGQEPGEDGHQVVVLTALELSQGRCMFDYASDPSPGGYVTIAGLSG